LAEVQAQIRTKEASLTKLGVPVPSGLASPQSLDLPNDLSAPMAEKARRDFSELQSLKGQFATTGGAELERSQHSKATSQDTITETQGKIQAIEADPKAVRVTRTPAPSLPPSENSNIAATQLQLTLERVIGNKLNGF
jgi:hypothetical protein